MADIQVPSIATATPAAADTVLGVQGGAVKRFSVSALPFTQAGAGAVARSVQAKLRESVSVEDFGSVPDWNGATGTNLADSLSRALVRIDGAGGTIKIPPGEYCLSSTVTIDGYAGTARSKGISIEAHGAKIFFTGSGAAFTFLHTNYARFVGAQIFLVNDTVGVVGVVLKHSRWGEFDADIFQGLTEYDGAGANTVGWKLESGPSDTYDNLYNIVRGRVRQAGWSLHLANDDTTASRNNANRFDIFINSVNGIKIEGCSGNEFTGSLESGVGTAIALKENAAGVPSSSNRFEFSRVESSGYSSWDFDVDASCVHNIFNIANLEYGVFNLPGQIIAVNGTGGAGNLNRLIPTAPRDQREFKATLFDIESKNWLMASEDFSAVQWVKANCTVTANSVAGPDGRMTADTLTITAANGNVTQTFSGASAGIWTAAVWLKATVPHTARLGMSTDNFATNENSASVYVHVTTEWQRFFVTFVATGGTSGGFIIHPADLGAASGELYAFGACVNKGYLGGYLRTGTNATPTDVGPIGAASAYPIVAPYAYFNERVNDGMTFNNIRKVGFATAAPTTGTHTAGDRLFNYSPSVGQPKGWICTASGTPGTWVSEGNL